MKRTAAVITAVVASAAGLARADLLVEPELLDAHREHILLRQPGDPDSGGSRHLSFEPTWGLTSGSHGTGGGSNYRRAGGHVEYTFFQDTDGLQNAISGLGYGTSQITLVGDDSEFTSATGTSHIQMQWDVIEPVLLDLSGVVRVADILMEGDGVGSAQAGVRFSGRGMNEFARLDEFTDDSLAFDWAFTLQPGRYTLEAWAYSFAFSGASDASIRSKPEYTFAGEFTAIPSPPSLLMLALAGISLGGRTRSCIAP